jgi:hypothetical protein
VDAVRANHAPSTNLAISDADPVGDGHKKAIAFSPQGVCRLPRAQARGLRKQLG